MTPHCLLLFSLAASAALVAFGAVPLRASDLFSDDNQEDDGWTVDDLNGDEDDGQDGGRKAPPGWPAWPFKPMGRTLDTLRREGEKKCSQARKPYVRACWNRLAVLAKAMNGTRDPRVWAAESREARVMTEVDDPGEALLSCILAAAGLKGSVWEGTLAESADGEAGDGPEARARALALELEFALQTRQIALKLIGKAPDFMVPAPVDESDEFGVRPERRSEVCTFEEVFGDMFGDGEVPGPGKAGGPAKRRGGGWELTDMEAERARRLESLKAELARTEARHGTGSRAAASVRFRYATCMSGEKGEGDSFGYPEVPRADLKEALRLCEDLPQALYGGFNPGPLDAERLVASILARTGKPKRARRTLRDALDEARASLGDEHRITLCLKADLGELLDMDEDSDPDEADDLLMEAEDGLHDVMGRIHPETIAARVAFARNALSCGAVAGSAYMLIDCASDIEKERGRDDYAAVLLRGMAGQTLLDDKDAVGAARILRKAVASAVRAGAVTHPKAFDIARHLSSALMLDGSPEALHEAASRSRALIDALRAECSEGAARGSGAGRRLALAMRDLGCVLTKSEEYSQAREAFAEERFAWARVCGPSSRKALEALGREASAALLMGSSRLSYAMYREAARLLMEAFGEDDPDTRENLRILSCFDGKNLPDIDRSM
ncbi:MAG: tetratricopeptide repeat protein [Deltaproteobacteria bacterium]|jgi:hypothetical protein|nr:tetratricopeptide repeat protein [Deltaproteobacteria bacterium]